jgi:hypothetical protein
MKGDAQPVPHKFETHMQECPRTQLGESKAASWFSAYAVTKGKLSANVLSEIKGIEPSLSDHGEDHIKHVLHNAYFLLNENSSAMVSLNPSQHRTPIFC